MSAADLTARRYLVDDEEGVELAREVSWADLVEVNESETMQEIADILVGAVHVLGMCDRIKRIA